ncbi:glycosyltransferase family 2 protein [Streptomyces gardneri]|uniref:glycosyltransferase family 2 protein n=1 Tax=Streptomyces gardneri TaxID=66892 RepID=UPI0036AAC1A2
MIATRLREDRLDYLTTMHASLTRQSVPWKAVIALDGADPSRLPAPLVADPRIRTLELPLPVGAACARNLAITQVRTPYVNWVDDDVEFTDDAMAVRLSTLESTGVGWCAGWSVNLHPDGSTHLWLCPTPPGRHEAGDVMNYWARPQDTIPIGPTTILARTDLVRAASMGGLVQCPRSRLAVRTRPSLCRPQRGVLGRAIAGAIPRDHDHRLSNPGASLALTDLFLYPPRRPGLGHAVEDA